MMRHALWPAALGGMIAILLGAGAAAGCRKDTAPEPAASQLERLRTWGRGQRPALLSRLVALAAVPSVSQQPASVEALADELRSAFAAVGMAVENLASDGPPLLLATGGNPRAEHTLLFYAHYDGQNVTAARWQHCQPFAPTLYDRPLSDPAAKRMPLATAPLAEDWRLCGRAVADDKGPIAVLLEVLRGIHENQLGPPAVGIKVVLDGAEESGSYNLEAALVRPENRDKLAADVLISLDGPVFPTGQPTLVFGVRGIMALDVVTYGGIGDLHSGHYGNWGPNPAQEMAWLLSTLKDPFTGEVRIPGFYDCRTPLSEADERALAAVPDIDARLRQEHGLGRVETQWSLKQAITYPSLNVRGLAAGDVGQAARTVIPARSEAAIDIRLVKGCTAERMHAAVRSYLEGLGYHVVEAEPSAAQRRAHARLVRLSRRSGGYAAVRTPTDWSLSNAVAAQVRAATGTEPVRLPTMGGSLPFYLFEQHLGMPLIGLPLVNHDNRQHSPDENVRLGHLFRGFDILATLLLSFADRPGQP